MTGSDSIERNVHIWAEDTPPKSSCSLSRAAGFYAVLAQTRPLSVDCEFHSENTAAAVRQLRLHLHFMFAFVSHTWRSLCFVTVVRLFVCFLYALVVVAVVEIERLSYRCHWRSRSGIFVALFFLLH